LCGIVGCVGKIWRSEEEAFKMLLQLDTIRGPHSTGVLSVGTTRENYDWLKQVGTPWELFECDQWGAFNRRAHRVLLGHNRWATRGKVDNDNAHPFEHEKVVGVHNGTISAQYRLKDHKKFEVDSDNIYYNISEEGIEETLKKLEGPFALVWYNKETGQLQMVRNKERPLYICKSDDGRTYFWASEPWMLRIALSKHDIKHTDPIEVKDGQLVSFDVPFGDVSKLDNFLPHTKAVEFYKAPTYQHSNTSYYPGHNNWHNHAVQKGGAKNNVVPFVRNAVSGDSLKQYLGKTVRFSVVGERTHNHQDYILCQVEDYLNPDLRIFTTKKTKLGKLLLDSNLMFSAKVKACTAKEQFGNYVTVDHRSIKELDQQGMQEMLALTHQRDEEAEKIEAEEAANEEMKMFPVYRGKMVTLEEWYANTAIGCTWCKDFPKPEEADALTWINPREYVCKLCAEEPEIQPYINDM